MNCFHTLTAGWLCVLVTNGTQLYADAVVVTKAASSSTIAEIFVEPTEIRIELEIGPQDLQSLLSLLPVKSGAAATNSEALAELFRNQMQIRTDTGQLLPVSKLEISTALRNVRDEITGQPLSAQPEPREQVVRILIIYPLKSKPASLSFTPPMRADSGYPAASIGFVTYHRGLPVNDFRYMSKEITLDLDWEDPWYSRFRHPNLGRQYDAPLSVFLYVEPYEVRREIVIRPRDLQEFTDLGLAGKQIIRVDEQEALKQKVVSFLADTGRVTIDGIEAEGRLDNVNFIHRSIRANGVVNPPEDLDLTSATLGVMFVYPTKGLPNEVTMNWDLFDERLQNIPAVASDEAGGLPALLTADEPTLKWQNFLTNPTIPEMLTVASPPKKNTVSVPTFSAACVVLLLIGLSVIAGKRRKGIPASPAGLVVCSGLMLAGCLLLPFGKVAVANPFSANPKLDSEGSQDVLFSLLHNIYRSFDRHDEELIYDQLAESISGDLLTQVYLETRESMEIRNQGGLKVAVKEVALEESSLLSHEGLDYQFLCRWRVSGSVGHWGHIHRRENEHVANITIADLNGRWKITQLDMLEQQSVGTGSPDAPAKR